MALCVASDLSEPGWPLRAGRGQRDRPASPFASWTTELTPRHAPHPEGGLARSLLLPGREG